MSNRWNITQVEELKKQGQIRGFKFNKPKKRQKDPAGRIVSKHFPKKSKEKDWMSWNLLYWSNQHAVTLEEEYKFHPDRKWRADWAIPALKILIEYEGLFSEKSRHTTARGFTGDAQKYNAAQQLGWKVLRFTALNYKNLIKDLDEVWANEQGFVSAVALAAQKLIKKQKMP